jgi:hypothetical protein
MEFTVDVVKQGSEVDYKLNILQCRPLSMRAEEAQGVEIPNDIPGEDILFRSQGLVPDGKALGIRYLVFINPVLYRKIPNNTIKLELGRAVSRLNRLLEKEKFVLMGPGRWGSSNLELGVRVSYADIDNTKVLIELGVAEGGIAPELSYGTHFFQDLVEANIYSLPLHLYGENHIFNWDFFQNSPNILTQLLPDDQDLSQYLQLIDVQAVTGRVLNILMDGLKDQAVGYLTNVA